MIYFTIFIVPEFQGEPDDISREKCKVAAREVGNVNHRNVKIDKNRMWRIFVTFTGFIQSPEFLKKSWIEICNAIFQSGKMVKSLEVFFKATTSDYKLIFFPLLGQSHSNHSISPIAKTINHRMRSFRTLLIPHCTMVTVHYNDDQCIICWSPIQ